MIGLRIGAAELAEIEAGAPSVVLAPGILLPHAPPLVPLVLRQSVLARPGADLTRSLPLPGWVKPLALVGPDHAIERLLPLLPPGLPVLPDATALLGALAGALREAQAERATLAAERDRLKRALGTVTAPLPRRVLLLPPVAAAGSAELPLTQPLGRAAEGICTVELHLVGKAPSRGLAVRLVAGALVLGAWRVPAAALMRGWLALDLPEPAPAGTAEAALEIAAEAGEGEAPALSLSADRPQASVALRAFAAPPGWSVLPRHFDWHASGATLPALPLPLPASLLAEASVDGASAELVGAGAEQPRLILDLPAQGEAMFSLPAAAVGAADLLRLRLTRRSEGSGPLSASAEVAASGGTIASGWRELDAAGLLALALPLPPGPMASLSLRLRHGGTMPAIVELSGLALQAGAAGEPRRPPPAEAAAPQRGGVPLPATAFPAGSLPQPAGWRAQAPAPRPMAAGPGGAAPTPAAPPPAAPPGGAAFQEVRLHQHLVSGEGSYRHLDIAVSGLVSGGGLWRQLRLKLFERRGVAGIEFRDMKGWPQMFDAWPAGGSDNYGSFWRLETDAAGTALSALATPHDRAFIAALLDVLPDLATRAAGVAGLDNAETEAWTGRARRLAQAVAEARGIRSAG